MRKAIRDLLVSTVSEVGEDVYEPTSAGAPTDPPFIMVKFAGETNSVIRQGYAKSIEVWVYTPRTSFTVLDNLCRKVRSILHETELVTETNKVFALEYNGQSSDYDDPEWRAFTRRLDFTVPNVIAG